MQASGSSAELEVSNQMASTVLWCSKTVISRTYYAPCITRSSPKQFDSSSHSSCAIVSTSKISVMASAILVIGSTGNQGGAVINALLAAPESLDMPILAVTRNTETAGAKALHSKSPSRIKLIKGDLNDCDGIFKAAKVPVKSVFFVPIPAIGPRMKIVIEEIQGKALIDAAVRNAVEHFVFTSVARYGDDSESTETDVPHFITKARIEKHLQEKAGKSMTWTILRPVTFMDNVNTSFAGKVFCTV